MSPESKPLQQLRNKIEQEKQTLQIIDASLVSLYKTVTKKTGKLASALGYDEKRYDQLHIDVSQGSRLMTQAKNSNYRAAIITLYSLWTDYMKGIVNLMYDVEPQKIAGKASGELKFSEIISLGSYDAIKGKITDHVFRSLESERSTSKLLDKILKHTDISLQPQIKTNALAYLEMRHLFIHSSGMADSSYVKNYGEVVKTCQEGKRLPRNYVTVAAAYAAVFLLCSEIDKLLIDGKFIVTKEK